MFAVTAASVATFDVMPLAIFPIGHDVAVCVQMQFAEPFGSLEDVAAPVIFVGPEEYLVRYAVAVRQTHK